MTFRLRSGALSLLLAMACAQAAPPPEYKTSGPITVRSQERSDRGCMELIITNSSQDEYFVKMAWQYNSRHASSPAGPGPYVSGRYSDSGFVSMHQLTKLERLRANSGNHIYCHLDYAFNFQIEAVNMSQQRRDADATLRNREAERQRQRDEALRQQEENRQNGLRMQQQMKDLQAKTEQDRIEAYRRRDAEIAARTGTGRCLIGNQADIMQCEQYRRRVEEEQRMQGQRDAETQRQREYEAQRQRDIQQAEVRQRQMEAEADRRRASPCNGADEVRRAGPQVQPYPANAQPHQRAHIDAVNAQGRQAWRQMVLELEERCRRATSAQAPQQPVYPQQQPQYPQQPVYPQQPAQDPNQDPKQVLKQKLLEAILKGR